MVEEVKSYHAEVTRDGRFWLIRVAELNRSTQAVRYKDVRTMAAELIEIMDDIGREDYELVLTVHLPDAVKDHLARAEALRHEAGMKNTEAAVESRAAVRELLANGLSQREAGELLGMSHQRVHQLVSG